MSDKERAYIAKTKPLKDASRNLTLDTTHGKLVLRGECLDDADEWNEAALDLAPCLNFTVHRKIDGIVNFVDKKWSLADNPEWVRDVVLLPNAIIQASVAYEPPFLGLGTQQWETSQCDLNNFIRIWNGYMDFMHPLKGIDEQYIPELPAWMETLGDLIEIGEKFDFENELDDSKQMDDLIEANIERGYIEDEEAWQMFSVPTHYFTHRDSLGRAAREESYEHGAHDLLSSFLGMRSNPPPLDICEDKEPNLIQITGETPQSTSLTGYETSDCEFRTRQRRHGRFECGIRLQNTVVEDEVQAHLEDGVLRIKVPRKSREAGKESRIWVTKGKGKQQEGEEGKKTEVKDAGKA
ncbi:hypothetical protein MNV49_007789 [Pseudohyphozyma bogoriensis]|nr:hypothetical protein MNV49_007789 [Pseudohyphozyma bogoriensis]